MTEDFYCDEVLSGKTQVKKLLETENILAYYHTNLFILCISLQSRRNISAL